MIEGIEEFALDAKTLAFFYYLSVSTFASTRIAKIVSSS